MVERMNKWMNNYKKHLTNTYDTDVNVLNMNEWNDKWIQLQTCHVTHISQHREHVIWPSAGRWLASISHCASGCIGSFHELLQKNYFTQRHITQQLMCYSIKGPRHAYAIHESITALQHPIEPTSTSSKGSISVRNRCNKHNNQWTTSDHHCNH